MAKKPKDVWGLPIPSASDVVSFLNNAVNQGRLASGDKQAVTPGDAGVRTLGMGISKTNDYLNPYANTTKQLLGMAAGNEGAQAKFAKSLARDVAITGAAVGLGAAAGKAINAAAKTSTAQRIGNAVRGETVVLHGSPISGMKTIEPRTALQNDELGPQVWSMRPTKTTPVESIVEGTYPYANKNRDMTGRLYVAKVPTKATNMNPVIKEQEMSAVEKFRFENYGIKPTARPNIKPNDEWLIRSSKPGKVVSETPIAGKSVQELTAVMKKELKAAGVKVEPNKVQRMLDKREAKKLAERQRIKNQNTVV
jgi:hypothetical protein